MKLLSRMYFLDWHYIRKEVITFEKINYLTGKTGMGKSTIIDALQLLMLGDTRGAYFNKAANVDSKRSLEGYLYGETDYNDTDGTVMLRQGHDFVTYICAEFLNTVSNDYFTIGAVFDCYSTGKYESRFYIYEGGIPDHQFIIDGRPLNTGDLKKHLENKYGKSKVGFFDKQYEYRDAFKGMMGTIKSDFFDLFRKAVPFTPIMDIKNFITEFVCDKSQKIEVETLQDNIRYYKRLENQVLRIKEQIAALQGIESLYSNYAEKKQEHQLMKYAYARGKADDAALKLEASNSKLGLKKRDFEEVDNEIHKYNVQKIKLKEDLAQALQDYYSNNEYNVINRLDREIEEAKQATTVSQNAQEQIEIKLGALLRQWKELAGVLLSNEETLDGVEQMDELAGELLGVLKFSHIVLTATQLNELLSLSQRIIDAIKAEYIMLRQEIEQLKSVKNKEETKLRELENGNKPYPVQGLVELKNTIEVMLREQLGKNIETYVFCELLEVKDKRWQNAIEGYLNTQRFHLLIEPAYFEEASVIYENMNKEMKLYDVGLVDIEKIKDRKPDRRAGSLAEEVQCDNQWGRLYADYLLGRVMKCERVQDLRAHQTAITSSCMVYSRYILKAINPNIYRSPYLGRQALAILIEQTKQLIQETSSKISVVTKKGDQYFSWSKAPVLSAMEVEQYAKDDGLIFLANELKARNELLASFQKQKNEMDLSTLVQLSERKEKLEEEITVIEQLEIQRTRVLSSLENEISGLETKEIPELIEAAMILERELKVSFTANWSKEHGEIKYANLSEKYKKGALINYANEQLPELYEEMVVAFRTVKEQRSKYIIDYRVSLDSSEEDNKSWGDEEKRLVGTSLPSFEDDILLAQRKAQEQFQDEFTGRLKENIDRVKDQIEELNSAIRMANFGKKKYKFEVRPNPQYREFYNMITDDLLMQGLNLWSAPFMDKHQETIDRLFKYMVYTGDGEGSEQSKELEENLALFSDYRTYLEFDLLEVDIETGAESKLSKVIGSKSGGETQTPFYIAVLASFYQTYRVKLKSHNNTLRLIVFDEAFSKMDHERIQECIKLVRDMGLQIILSAPTDKLSDIAPLVDRVNVVTRVGKNTIVRPFDPKDLEESNAELLPAVYS